MYDRNKHKLIHDTSFLFIVFVNHKLRDFLEYTFMFRFHNARTTKATSCAYTITLAKKDIKTASEAQLFSPKEKLQKFCILTLMCPLAL